MPRTFTGQAGMHIITKIYCTLFSTWLLPIFHYLKRCMFNKCLIASHCRVLIMFFFSL
uniref:Uncharacterized protein n=1 Tax=Anguilla anguilla TaxID=7936 RepID=A0A0E9T380_ANGAN